MPKHKPSRLEEAVDRGLSSGGDISEELYGLGKYEIASEQDAVLEVRDSGDPLPNELRDRIFQPYESSGPVRGQPAAIGLGLAVSRTLAELMDGHPIRDSLLALRGAGR